MPCPLTIALTAALALWLSGWRMTPGVVAGLGFVLTPGFWNEGMTTLALVAVSVPRALLVSGLDDIG